MIATDRTTRPSRAPLPLWRGSMSHLILLTAAAVLLLVLVAAPASAATTSPWWHLGIGTRAANLKAGQAQNEVQEIVGTPAAGETGVAFELLVNGVSLEFFASEPLAAELGGIPLADAPTIQAALEGPYGEGNVTVTGGPVGDAPLIVTATGEKAAQAVPAIEIVEVGFGQVTSKVTAEGRPDGEVFFTAENVGDGALSGVGQPVRIAITLPAGLEATGIAGTAPESSPNGGLPIPCSPADLSCVFSGGLAPFQQLEVRVAVKVRPGAHSGELIAASLTGGAAPSDSISRPITISAEPTPFAVGDYRLGLEEAGGLAAGQAGAHPFQVTGTVAINQGPDTAGLESGGRPRAEVAALPKDILTKLPAGLVGNATNIPTCSLDQFQTRILTFNETQNACPAASAVGVASATAFEPQPQGFSTVTFTEPLFNIEPAPGEPARFGFLVPLVATPVLLDTVVRSEPGGDYGIDVDARNISQEAGLSSARVTFWGVPGDLRHDTSRGWGCLEESLGQAGHEPCVNVEDPTPSPLLQLPTSCTGPLQTSVETDAWIHPGIFTDSSPFEPIPALVGCNQLAFGPTIAAKPTTTAAASPSGLAFDLNFDDEGMDNPAGNVESQVKKAVVALPTGVTTNPAVAGGLGACSQAQYNEENLANEAGCPESSKVGEVEIQSPLVKPTIHGAIYVAKQHDNPAGNLLSIYMVAKNPELGILVRSAGAVTPNPQTGQLTTTFDDLPQLPFSHFRLSFREGPRAPLITPGLCGTYSTQADLYPYSNPEVETHREATFTVSSGANGRSCASSESQLPNKPTLEAGSTSPLAGAYAPFVFKVNREDGSQVLSQVSATLPEGLLGKLAGIPYCTEAQIHQAESRSGEGQGATEIASPSCPAASQVGTVNVGTGAGTQPYYVQGKAYLAGPYKGAPLSLAIITPAIAGPFDLGTVVVRTALYVNETTTQIHAVSDPLPTILHGLPLVVRSVALNMDRSNFTLNPTSCDPMQVSGSVTSTLGNVAPVSQRFQVGACGALGFKPGLKLSLTGQTKRAGHPALKAVLTYPKGSYANIARAQVSLPGSEFLDQGNLNLVCKQADLKAGTCPKKAIYGKVKAWSPLLEKPLQGNVYLGVGFGYKLPALVAELDGQIRVLLVGKIDTDKQKGIRNTFLAVPDAAVSRFELTLKGGKKYGLLENSENICKKTQKAEAQFNAQNGKVESLAPTIANSCGKGKGTKGKKKKGATSKGGK
jgi:hypothetical protein